MYMYLHIRIQAYLTHIFASNKFPESRSFTKFVEFVPMKYNPYTVCVHVHVWEYPSAECFSCELFFLAACFAFLLALFLSLALMFFSPDSSGTSIVYKEKNKSFSLFQFNQFTHFFGDYNFLLYHSKIRIFKQTFYPS